MENTSDFVCALIMCCFSSALLGAYCHKITLDCIMGENRDNVGRWVLLVVMVFMVVGSCFSVFVNAK